MVKSGLIGRVDVSQYRLAMHLTMAFVILGITFNIFLENNLRLVNNNYFNFKSNYEFLFLLSLIFIFLQIAYGAFVSGTHSGLLFNTWPFYNGSMFPFIENNELSGLINFFETGEYIIFIHRTFAIFLLLLVLSINYIFFKTNDVAKKNILLIIFNISFLSKLFKLGFKNIKYSLSSRTSILVRISVSIL